MKYFHLLRIDTAKEQIIMVPKDIYPPVLCVESNVAKITIHFHLFARYNADKSLKNNKVNKAIPILLQTAVITIFSLFVLKSFGIYGAATSFLIASVYLAYKYTTYSNNLLKQQEQQENIKENTWNSKI